MIRSFQNSIIRPRSFAKNNLLSASFRPFTPIHHASIALTNYRVQSVYHTSHVLNDIEMRRYHFSFRNELRNVKAYFKKRREAKLVAQKRIENEDYHAEDRGIPKKFEKAPHEKSFQWGVFHVYAWLKYVSAFYGHSFKKLFSRLKKSTRIVYKTTRIDKREMTWREDFIVNQTLMSMIKLVPYIALFIIPGSTLVIPVFGALFPWSLPVEFHSQHYTLQRMSRIIELEYFTSRALIELVNYRFMMIKEGDIKLLKTLHQQYRYREDSPDKTDDFFDYRSDLLQELTRIELLEQQYLEKKLADDSQFTGQLELDIFPTSTEARKKKPNHINKFMIKLFFDFHESRNYFRWMFPSISLQRMLLKRQVRTIKQDDLSIEEFGVEKLTRSELMYILSARGISLFSLTEKECPTKKMRSFLKEWIAFSKRTKSDLIFLMGAPVISHHNTHMKSRGILIREEVRQTIDSTAAAQQEDYDAQRKTVESTEVEETRSSFNKISFIFSKFSKKIQARIFSYKNTASEKMNELQQTTTKTIHDVSKENKARYTHIQKSIQSSVKKASSKMATVKNQALLDAEAVSNKVQSISSDIKEGMNSLKKQDIDDDKKIDDGSSSTTDSSSTTTTNTSTPPVTSTTDPKDSSNIEKKEDKEDLKADQPPHKSHDDDESDGDHKRDPKKK